MVRVRVLLFASYREIAGASQVEVRVPDGTTVHGVLQELRSRGAPFDRLPADAAAARNREYVASDTVLADGDELALLPPVAGG